jgi:hypothetical protein
MPFLRMLRAPLTVLTRPCAPLGPLVVWAGQPNISAVVARAAERCGLLGPPRALGSPQAVAPADDADAGVRPLPPPLPHAQACRARAFEQEDAMALD